MSIQAYKKRPHEKVYLNIFPACFILCLGFTSYTQTVYAQFPNGETHIQLSTDTAVCDQDLGIVEVNVDAFGALGSALGSVKRHYNPFGDSPDQGLVGTIFEWKTSFCKEDSTGTASQSWFQNNEMQATNPVVSVTDGEVSSEFVHDGVRVNMRYWLDCTTINYCYRLSNESNDTIPSISLTPYLDPDLYFGSGGLSNDYGAASSARPKTLWAFDTGSDVTIPTSYVGIKTLGNDSYLNSWEVGSYSGQRIRIQTTNNGCTVLRNDINRN